MSRFDFLNNSRYEKIYKACVDAERYADIDSSVTASKARIALERIVENLGGDGENLFEKIESLGVPAHIEECFHTVRMVGNKGSHGDEVADEETEEALDALYRIVSWIAQSKGTSTFGTQLFSNESETGLQISTQTTYPAQRNNGSTIEHCSTSAKITTIPQSKDKDIEIKKVYNTRDNSYSQGDYSVALELDKEVYKKWGKNVGNDDKNTAKKWPKEELYRIGETYYKQGNYCEALKSLQEAANSGHYLAQIAVRNLEREKGDELGEEYYQVHDYYMAKIWYQRAANLGNINAMYKLGNMYYEGQGVQRDYGMAKAWYQKAANLGNSKAMCKLRTMYFEGRDVQKDNEKSITFFRNAGNEKTKVSFKEKFKMQLEKASIQELYAIGNKYYIQHDFGKAIQYYCKSANAGNIDAMIALGHIYKKGEGTYQSYAEAMKWYQKVAEAGNAIAMANIGWLYAEGGNGIEQDYDEAIKWFNKSIEAGNIGAKHAIEKIQNKRSLIPDGCYITTAVCDSLYKPDDCYELMTFRAFRDNWLKKQADGESLIQEYYEIAPVIVDKIDSLPNATDVYHKIWREYLSPCLTMIECGDMEGCKKMYMKMVKELSAYIESIKMN